MARNIVKDYLSFEKKSLIEYITTITEKKLSSEICDIIANTYINVRYYDMYEHVKKNTADNIDYYVIENVKKVFNEKNKEKNIPLVIEALIVLRYVYLYEKFHNDPKATKELTKYEKKLKNRYENTKILVLDLVKLIKNNTHKKEKFLEELLSNDFSIFKKDTNIKNVYDLYFDNSVKIPDLFSDVAINRVYNSGAINEDKMLIFYTLTTREIIIDMENFKNDNQYLVDFPNSLITKKNKLSSLFKIIDGDYLKDRIVLKVLYSEYLENKEEYDSLIHNGYSLAIIVDDTIKGNMVLLNVFTYIITEEKNKNKFTEFNNVIFI